MRPVSALITLLLVGVLTAPAAAQAPDGAAVYQASCASCHANPGPESRAPNREILATLAPESILVTLTSGQMFRQGSALTDAERKAVAAFLAGRPVGTAAPASTSVAARRSPLRSPRQTSPAGGTAGDRRRRTTGFRTPTRAA